MLPHARTVSTRSFSLAALFLTSIFLQACGGGGGSSSNSAPTPARSLGAIEQKGSIFVNGVKFETEGAQLLIENEPTEIIGADDSKLRIGMIVEVQGKINDDGITGVADRILADDNLEGPITSVVTSPSGLSKTVVLLGHTIIVEDGVTVFDNNDPAFDSFAELGSDDVGKVIEVTGFTQDDGSIRATFIEKKADTLAAFLAVPGSTLEVKGIVNTVTGNTFTIAGSSLIVDFTSAAPRNGALASGVLVEVKGDDVTGNTLRATDVEVQAEGLDDIAEAEVEGFVTGLDTAAKTLTLNGQSVNYANAAFRGGIEADLANGVKVEAEGPLSGGVLNAQKVTFKESLRFEGNVAVVTGNSLTLQGLPGVSILIDDVLTRGAAALSLINPGDGVKIRARQAAGNTLVATRLEEISPVNHAILQGPVSSFSAADNRVTILGIDVNTATINADDFKDNDTIIGRAAFFGSLQAGDLVKARFDFGQGAAGEWDQIEFED